MLIMFDFGQNCQAFNFTFKPADVIVLCLNVKCKCIVGVWHLLPQISIFCALSQSNNQHKVCIFNSILFKECKMSLKFVGK